MIKYKNNINVGTGSVGYEADATSAAPLDTVSGGRIVKSEGRTVKWNQMVNPSAVSTNTVNDITITNNGDGSFTLNGTASATITFVFIGGNDSSIIIGHKFYVPAQPYLSLEYGFIAMNSFASTAKIQTASASNTYIIVYSGATVTELVFWPRFIDLTSIFGAGNEPTTVEAFESWLAENMVEQDYYAYDAGSLVPVTVKGVKRDVGGTTVTNPMPVTTLKDENDVVMFPDGLKSAGSVKDEIDWEHGVAVKRVGVVDLGLFTYTKTTTSSSNSRFVSNLFSDIGIPDSKALSSSSIKANAICSDLVVRTGDEVYLENEGVSILKDGNKCSIYLESFKDSTDATAFKTAMSGVLLYYELATPITYHFATHADLKKRVVKIGESVEVDGIEGETVVWNQYRKDNNTEFSGDGIKTSYDSATHLICIENISRTSNYSSGSNQLVVTNNNITYGHKFISITSIGNDEGIRLAQSGYGSDVSYIINAIFTASHANDIEIKIRVTNEYDFVNEHPIGNKFYFYFNIFDLTLMFGSGNEPATVAEFESWLSAHGGIKDYYTYCAGELKDKEEGNVRGVGFNLWDEEVEGGGYSTDTGLPSNLQNNFRSKNFIPVLPSTTYSLTRGNCPGSFYTFEYDMNKNFITRTAISDTIFTTLSNTQYLKFMFYKANSNWGNVLPSPMYNICINLSDPSRNGTYVPYKSITRSVDLTTLKGKVNGAGEDVVMFPDGMKQAGSVKDEIFVEGGVVKAVKRVGTVDLGTLTWVYDSTSGSYPVFYAYITDLSTQGSKLICQKYIAEYDAGWSGFINSDQNGKIGAPSTQYRTYVIIQDSAYTSASDFTTAMQGVMLNYELASPVTYVVNMQGMEMAEVKKVIVGTQKVWEMSV